ncbi:MAG: hypothetical protein ACFFAH_01985 [Promethearchaeota archaeon]
MSTINEFDNNVNDKKVNKPFYQIDKNVNNSPHYNEEIEKDLLFDIIRSIPIGNS